MFRTNLGRTYAVTGHLKTSLTVVEDNHWAVIRLQGSNDLVWQSLSQWPCTKFSGRPRAFLGGPGSGNRWIVCRDPLHSAPHFSRLGGTRHSEQASWEDVTLMFALSGLAMEWCFIECIGFFFCPMPLMPPAVWLLGCQAHHEVRQRLGVVAFRLEGPSLGSTEVGVSDREMNRCIKYRIK